MSNEQETNPSNEQETPSTETEKTEQSLASGGKPPEGDGETAGGETKTVGGEAENETPSEKKPGEDEKPGEGEEAPTISVENLKIPEGFDAEDPAISEYADILNNQEMSSEERAQALIDLHAKTMQEASERVSEQWTETRKGWVEQVQNDPDIGGDKLDESLGVVAEVVNEFGGDDFRQLMDDSGLGDHPTMVKFLHSVGKSFKEGSPATGAPADTSTSLADRIYGKSSS